VIFGNNDKEDLPLENDYISGVDKCKYFRVLFNKTGYSSHNNNKQWHYSPDGRKPPLIWFHSVS
jgi:hypothetical protein